MVLTNYTEQIKYLLAVDCVIFGYQEDELKLLLFKRQIEPSIGKWSLVGGWLEQHESVEDAAKRVLLKLTGLEDIYMEQVQVFSFLNRDPGGRVISIVFYALIRKDENIYKVISDYGAEWKSISNLPELIFDHAEMVEGALLKLRNKASYELIGRQLLPEKFTLLQLRKLYNAIFQRTFDPGNFRKKILSTKLLSRLDIKNTTESKKGAFYYKFVSDEEDSSAGRIVKI